MPSATPEDCDALYRDDPDPWNFRDSPYEHAKYRATLDFLPRARYGHILEVGCAIGVLGRLLAGRCDRYLGIDASARALDEARRGAPPNMDFRLICVPEAFPDGPFDLVVLSEILYFLCARDVRLLASRIARSADVILVNWTGSTDRDLQGPEAAELFAAAFGRQPDRVTEVRHFRVDIFRATS